MLSLNVFYDAPEQLEQLVTARFGSQTLRLESCAGAPGPRAPSRRAWAMASSEADEIKARLERVRKREEDLDGRLALLVAKEHDVDQAALERQLKDLEAERLEAIATGKHGRASAAASGSPQPPISDAADDDESSEDCRGHVEPGFDSSEVTRLDYVAKNLFQTHGKDAVIKLINALRDTFASNITPTDLQDMGGEDLVKILVQIAAGNCVGAADLSEMHARGTRECEE